MAKSLLYTFFRLGKIPDRWKPVLRAEGIRVWEEGIPGRAVLRKVKGPGRRHYYRTSSFSGCIVLTEQRLLVCSFWQEQINLPLKDSRISKLFYDVQSPNRLLLSFNAADFRDDWQGLIELRLKTDQAGKLGAYLSETEATSGAASAN